MPTRHRILVVEDELSLRTGIVDLLAFKGHAPEGVGTGTDGLKRALEADFSLIILDLMLPGLNGLDVCRRVREAKPAQPILLLTAKGREEDILAGFEVGCDDYVTKPFSLSILTARVDALLRRSDTPDPTLQWPGLSIDVANYRAVGEQTVDLNPRDVSLMQYLSANADRVVTREELLREVWGYRSTARVETRAIDMHMVKLRRKLAVAAPGVSLVETVRGVGYRLAP